MKLFFISLFSLLVAFTPASRAQVSTLSLMGNVQSDDQRAIPGAAVTVIHMPSGVRHATASDQAGRFMVPNLMVGGPYLIRVGEGGYRPQTVENIFLEAGKTANFTLVLNRLTAEAPRNSASQAQNPAAEPQGTTMTLAKEAAVGGPVLVTLTPNRPRSGGSAARPPAAAPTAMPTVSTPVASVPTASPAPSSPANSQPSASPAGPAARYRRRPYTPGKPYAPKKVTDPIVPGHFDAKSGNYLYHTGAPTTLKLPNGASIAEVGANSTESFLYRFLSDPTARVDTADLTKGWYNFDRVFFMPGKATLAPESVGQLRNIAALLKAYPTARIKLGGYTDSTGTYKVNKQLSEARARTAWASLVEMGISPSRIDARGYGPRYSIAPNTSEEGRAMNRRLSVKVLQK
ncbi:OmpA family protein [Hymenobacter sp. 5317J-9]|uniref:OmpA family protein n=1 Tax=Hymenobacter sp. 5317J-9 TaxID=2932250 RepID=UPI001FD66235|nr:OmpA family protein [Hymenobacter sp. 5317J-9]UOQ98118.1 OmpA family protein [Hymenobacter sp. 5317J-9]